MDTPASTTAPKTDAPIPSAAWGDAVARRHAAAGRLITLQGTVAHLRPERTAAVYAAVAALLSLVGTVYPQLATCALIMVTLSAVVDLDAGRGWLRKCMIARPSQSVVVWPTETAGPLLLIVAPLEPEVQLRGPPSWLLKIPLWLLLAAVGGATLMHWRPDLGTATLLSTAICMGLVCLTALSWRLLADHAVTANPARAALELAIGQIERAKLRRLRCAFAYIGADHGHHDGIEILLRNYRHRLDPDRTRVLVLQPDDGPLGVVNRDGRIRRRPADALLVQELHRLGLPSRARTTAAARAQRAGWRAAAMTLGPEQIHAGAGLVCRLAQDLDASLTATQAEE